MSSDSKTIGWPLAVVAAIILAMAAPAHAVDGVIEINQARALAGGVTTGDEPGFPVTITQPGSYRLTGNLTVDTSSSAIVVAASHVTIDLNGFVIAGTTSHVGAGVEASTAPSNIAVLNGTVRSFFDGVSVLSWQSRVENVVALNNRNTGIKIGFVCTVRGNTASGNGLGISTGRGCSITGNAVYDNHANAVGDGVVTLGAGILAGGGSVVIANTVRLNTGPGLAFEVNDSGSGYGNNVLTRNNGGDANAQVDGNGVQMGQNICGTALCP